MVEKKEGGKRATRHVAHTFLRLMHGGIAPFFILRSGHLRACVTWWRHTLNHRLLPASVLSGHGRSIWFETEVTASIAPPRAPEPASALRSGIISPGCSVLRSDQMPPSARRSSVTRPAEHVQAGQDAEPALEVDGHA